MKKSHSTALILTALAAIFLFCACSKEEMMLKGDWINVEDENEILNFKTNGTGKATQDGLETLHDFIYTIENKEITFTSTENKQSWTFIYELDDDTLSLSNDNGSHTYSKSSKKIIKTFADEH